MKLTFGKHKKAPVLERQLLLIREKRRSSMKQTDLNIPKYFALIFLASASLFYLGGCMTVKTAGVTINLASEKSYR
jgi:hypothetical protein